MLEALQRETRSSRRCSGKLVTRLQYRHLGRNKKVAPASRPTAAMAAATTETARPHQKKRATLAGSHAPTSRSPVVLAMMVVVAVVAGSLVAEPVVAAVLVPALQTAVLVLVAVIVVATINYELVFVFSFS